MFVAPFITIWFPTADVQLPVFVFPSLMTCFFWKLRILPQMVSSYILWGGRVADKQPLGVGRKTFQLSQLLGTVYLRYVAPFLRLSLKYSASGVHYGNWLNDFYAFPSLYHFPMALPVSWTSQINHFYINTYPGSASKAAQLMIHKLRGG